jgi:acyl-homoserine lactone acylase PvdQ
MFRLVLAVATAGAVIGCGSDADEPGPFDSVPLGETVKADGLTSPVHIVRDEFGVSHIHARDIGDLGFANGYVLASDRIQQMDLFRHAAAGRLAWLLGSLELDVIDDDLEMRMHRLLHFAQLSYEELKQSSDPADQ